MREKKIVPETKRPAIIDTNANNFVETEGNTRDRETGTQECQISKRPERP